MAASCQRYPQSVQFTFQHKTYLTYDDAKRALINKNLLEAEPAVVFYYSGNPRTEHVMLGIGNKHDSSQPLIITESISPEEVTMLTSIIGDEPINIPITDESGKITYLTTITSALNYLANAVDLNNFLGDYDYSNNLAKIFEGFYYPKYANGIYTYKIHTDDDNDTLAQLEIYLDEEGNTVQVFTDENGKKLTRTRLNDKWTASNDVIPFTKEYLQDIVGTTIIDDSKMSLKSTWSSKKISDEIDSRIAVIEIDSENVYTDYEDPDTHEVSRISQSEWNKKLLENLNDLVIDVIPEWKPMV